MCNESSIFFAEFDVRSLRGASHADDGVHSMVANLSLLGWCDGTAALIRKSPPSRGRPVLDPVILEYRAIA
jgi:hypothetical protein